MHHSWKIAATVILYNPTDDLIYNIHHYLKDVDIVYAVDNSDQDDPGREAKLKAIEKVRYVRNKGNLGIANALNKAADLAIRDGYDFLLTMDQDSKVTQDMIDKMLECIGSENFDDIAIITPFHLYRSIEYTLRSQPCEHVLTTMTSGNLLNLQAYQIIGPFLDDLFIDFVDHEYNLRSALKNFKIIRANRAILEHSLGNITIHKFIKKIVTGNHSPIRRYYSYRNKFFLRDRYKNNFPEFFHKFYISIAYEVILILLFEHDKIHKLKMMFKGYIDYRKGIFGKYRTS